MHVLEATSYPVPNHVHESDAEWRAFLADGVARLLSDPDYVIAIVESARRRGP